MLMCAHPGLAADASGPPVAASSGTDSSAKGSPPRLPTLAEIIIEAERSDALDHEVRKRFGDPRPLEAAKDTLRTAEAAIATARAAVAPDAPERMQVFALIDLAMEVHAHSEKVGAAVLALEARAQAYDTDLDRIDAMRTQWSARLDAARRRDAPEDLLRRIESVPGRLDVLAREVTQRRNETLTVLERASRLRGQMNTLTVEASERRNQLIDSLTAARAEPLWRAQPRADAQSLASAWITGELNHFWTYVARYWRSLLWAAIAAFALTYALAIVARSTLAVVAPQDNETEIGRRMFGQAVATSLLVALLAALLIAPDAPLVFYGATLTLLFAVSAILTVRGLQHRAVLTLSALTVVLVVNWFQAGFDALPFSGRLLLIAQCVLVAAALWLDLRREKFNHDAQILPPQAMRIVAWISIGLLGVAIFADVVGALGQARLLRDGVLRTLGFAVLINALTRVAHSFTLALLLSRFGRLSRIVTHRAEAIRRTLRWVLKLLALAAWIVGSLFSFRALGFLDWLQDTVSDARIEIGTVAISATAVLQCAVVLTATWAIVKAIRLLLEVELLPRSKLTSGTSFVISAAIRYVLVVAGVILGMAALGLDFSKVTLLVSAIGVGIGFGLQNVVNNFVSGLMLLGERVVNIGDTVQVGNLTGVVRRIGVRSTTVRTSQGAEVIVPNGDLTSKDVINFTLSDRHRRLDITVGVACDSDPQKVARLLTEAARSCAAVLAAPAPVAALIGFGDSTLNFRLQAWIGNYEDGLATETALRIAILARFEAEGIRMPFPQHDIHIHSMAGTPLPQV